MEMNLINSINIDVYDKEPEIAKNRVNDIVRLVDKVMNKMIRERSIIPMYTVQYEVDLIKQKT